MCLELTVIAYTLFGAISLLLLISWWVGRNARMDDDRTVSIDGPSYEVVLWENKEMSNTLKVLGVCPPRADRREDRFMNFIQCRQVAQDEAGGSGKGSGDALDTKLQSNQRTLELLNKGQEMIEKGQLAIYHDPLQHLVDRQKKYGCLPEEPQPRSSESLMLVPVERDPEEYFSGTRQPRQRPRRKDPRYKSEPLHWEKVPPPPNIPPAGARLSAWSTRPGSKLFEGAQTYSFTVDVNASYDDEEFQRALRESQITAEQETKRYISMSSYEAVERAAFRESLKLAQLAKLDDSKPTGPELGKDDAAPEQTKVPDASRRGSGDACDPRSGRREQDLERLGFAPAKRNVDRFDRSRYQNNRGGRKDQPGNYQDTVDKSKSFNRQGKYEAQKNKNDEEKEELPTEWAPGIPLQEWEDEEAKPAEGSKPVNSFASAQPKDQRSPYKSERSSYRSEEKPVQEEKRDKDKDDKFRGYNNRQQFNRRGSYQEDGDENRSDRSVDGYQKRECKDNERASFRDERNESRGNWTNPQYGRRGENNASSRYQHKQNQEDEKGSQSTRSNKSPVCDKSDTEEVKENWDHEVGHGGFWNYKQVERGRNSTAYQQGERGQWKNKSSSQEKGFESHGLKSHPSGTSYKQNDQLDGNSNESKPEKKGSQFRGERSWNNRDAYQHDGQKDRNSNLPISERSHDNQWQNYRSDSQDDQKRDRNSNNPNSNRQFGNRSYGMKQNQGDQGENKDSNNKSSTSEHSFGNRSLGYRGEQGGMQKGESSDNTSHTDSRVYNLWHGHSRKEGNQKEDGGSSTSNTVQTFGRGSSGQRGNQSGYQGGNCSGDQLGGHDRENQRKPLSDQHRREEHNDRPDVGHNDRQDGRRSDHYDAQREGRNSKAPDSPQSFGNRVYNRQWQSHHGDEGRQKEETRSNSSESGKPFGNKPYTQWQGRRDQPDEAKNDCSSSPAKLQYSEENKTESGQWQNTNKEKQAMQVKDTGRNASNCEIRSGPRSYNPASHCDSKPGQSRKLDDISKANKESEEHDEAKLKESFEKGSSYNWKSSSNTKTFGVRRGSYGDEYKTDKGENTSRLPTDDRKGTYNYTQNLPVFGKNLNRRVGFSEELQVYDENMKAGEGTELRRFQSDRGQEQSHVEGRESDMKRPGMNKTADKKESENVMNSAVSTSQKVPEKIMEENYGKANANFKVVSAEVQSSAAEGIDADPGTNDADFDATGPQLQTVQRRIEELRGQIAAMDAERKTVKVEQTACTVEFKMGPPPDFAMAAAQPGAAIMGQAEMTRQQLIHPSISPAPPVSFATPVSPEAVSAGFQDEHRSSMGHDWERLMAALCRPPLPTMGTSLPFNPSTPTSVTGTGLPGKGIAGPGVADSGGIADTRGSGSTSSVAMAGMMPGTGIPVTIPGMGMAGNAVPPQYMTGMYMPNPYMIGMMGQVPGTQILGAQVQDMQMVGMQPPGAVVQNPAHIAQTANPQMPGLRMPHPLNQVGGMATLPVANAMNGQVVSAQSASGAFPVAAQPIAQQPNVEMAKPEGPRAHTPNMVTHGPQTVSPVEPPPTKTQPVNTQMINNQLSNLQLNNPHMTNIPLNGQLNAQMNAQMTAQMNTQTNAQMNAQTNAQMNAQSNAQMNAQMTAQTNAQMNAQTNAQMNAQMNAQTNAQMNAQMNAQTSTQMNAHTNTQMISHANPQANAQFNAHFNAQMSVQMNGQVSDAQAANLMTNANMPGIRMPNPQMQLAFAHMANGQNAQMVNMQNMQMPAARMPIPQIQPAPMMGLPQMPNAQQPMAPAGWPGVFMGMPVHRFPAPYFQSPQLPMDWAQNMHMAEMHYLETMRQQTMQCMVQNAAGPGPGQQDVEFSRPFPVTESSWVLSEDQLNTLKASMAASGTGPGSGPPKPKPAFEGPSPSAAPGSE